MPYFSLPPIAICLIYFREAIRHKLREARRGPATQRASRATPKAFPVCSSRSPRSIREETMTASEIVVISAKHPAHGKEGEIKGIEMRVAT